VFPVLAWQCPSVRILSAVAHCTTPVLATRRVIFHFHPALRVSSYCGLAPAPRPPAGSNPDPAAARSFGTTAGEPEHTPALLVLGRFTSRHAAPFPGLAVAAQRTYHHLYINIPHIPESVHTGWLATALAYMIAYMHAAFSSPAHASVSSSCRSPPWGTLASATKRVGAAVFLSATRIYGDLTYLIYKTLASIPATTPTASHPPAAPHPTTTLSSPPSPPAPSPLKRPAFLSPHSYKLRRSRDYSPTATFDPDGPDWSPTNSDAGASRHADPLSIPPTTPDADATPAAPHATPPLTLDVDPPIAPPTIATIRLAAPPQPSGHDPPPPASPTIHLSILPAASGIWGQPPRCYPLPPTPLFRPPPSPAPMAPRVPAAGTHAPPRRPARQPHLAINRGTARPPTCPLDSRPPVAPRGRRHPRQPRSASSRGIAILPCSCPLKPRAAIAIRRRRAPLPNTARPILIATRLLPPTRQPCPPPHGATRSVLRTARPPTPRSCLRSRSPSSPTPALSPAPAPLPPSIPSHLQTPLRPPHRLPPHPARHAQSAPRSHTPATPSPPFCRTLTTYTTAAPTST